MGAKSFGGKQLWVAFAVVSGALFFCVALGVVLDVGVAVGRVHPYLEYGWWAFGSLALGAFIGIPIVDTLARHRIPWGLISDEDQDIPKHVQAKLARAWSKSGLLSDEARNALSYNQKLGRSQTEDIRRIAKSQREAARLLVRERAAWAFEAIAVSQSGPLDAISLVAINLYMIRDITRAIGGRPPLGDLSALYTRVFMAGVVAGRLEDGAMDQALQALGGGVLGKVALPSLTQGVAAAFVTLRVGHLTEIYLTRSNEEPFDLSNARRSAVTRSLKDMPKIAGSLAKTLATGVWDKVIGLSGQSADGEAEPTTEEGPAVGVPRPQTAT